jgi:hypothetical protein
MLTHRYLIFETAHSRLANCSLVTLKGMYRLSGI